MPRPSIGRIGVLLKYLLQCLCKKLKRPLSRCRHRWLSKEARKELRKMGCGARRDSAPSRAMRLRKLLTRSPGVLATVCATLALNALFAAKIWFLLERLGWRDQAWRLEGFLSDLWQVQASILGLTLVLIVLLVQTRASDSGSDALFRFYIQESLVVPIVVYGLVQLVWAGVTRFLLQSSRCVEVLFDAATMASGLSFVFFVVLNIRLYGTTLAFVSPGYARSARVALLGWSVQEAVTAAAEQAVGRAIMRKHCSDLALLWSPSFGWRDDLTPVQSERFGRITDVDLMRLVDLSRELERTVHTDSESGRTYRAAVLKELGSMVGPRGGMLARVHPGDATRRVTRIVRSAYKITPETRPPEDALEETLRLLKDEAATNLREMRANAFADTLQAYSRIVDRMLDLWHAQSLPINVASSPLAGIGRTPLAIIQRDLFDITRSAISTGDPDFAGEAMYLPIRLLRPTLKFDEHELYRRFAQMMIGAYRLVAADRETRGHSFVVDRCWRYLKEHVDWHIAILLEQDTTDLDDLPKLAEGLVSVVHTYNGLLKAAIDAGDEVSFELFGTALGDLRREHDTERLATDILMLELQLEHGGNQDGTVALDRDRLARLRAQRDAWDRVHRLVELAWFGLGAWILRQMQGGSLAWDRGRPMLDVCRAHLGDLHRLSILYLKIQAEGPRLMGWDNWVASQLPAGEVHWIDTKTWMRAFYCVQGLRLTPDDIAEEGTIIKPDRHWKGELDELGKACALLRESAEGLREIMTEGSLGRIERFLELHRRALGEGLQLHEDWLIEQEISEMRRRAFRDEVARGYGRAMVLRKAFATFGGLAVRSEFAADSVRVRTVPRLIEKAVFVEDKYVSYGGYGDTLGVALARAEDHMLFADVMQAGLEQIESVQKELGHMIGQARELLRSKGYEPDLVLMARSTWVEQRRVLRNDRTRSRWPSQLGALPGYVDTVQGLPVVATDIYGQGGIVVADLSAFARLGQDEAGAGDEIGLDVSTIDESEARLQLEKQSRGQSALEGHAFDDAVRGLQLQVRVTCSRPVAFEVVDPNAAVVIRIRPPEEE